MEIIRESGTISYRLIYNSGNGWIYMDDLFVTLEYTHKIVYKDALYYFGKNEYNNLILVEGETGAIAINGVTMGNKVTSVKKFAEKLLEKENDAKAEMPEIIQKYKQRINFLDVWQTKLFIG